MALTLGPGAAAFAAAPHAWAAAPAQQSAPHGAHRLPSANLSSTNWAGYAAGSGHYGTVSASWIEPSVACTSRGIAAFWVGLDGWGSGTVEQEGTGVDCTGGTPQHFAWWETYPANSMQQYGDPVAVGDHLTATVTAKPGGVYDLVLTDATHGWAEHNSARMAGAADASAEIIAEAVTAGDAVTSLPDFHAVDFTDARIDGSAAPSAGAVPVDMTDRSGTRLAATQNSDSAGDFVVSYTGSAHSMTTAKAAETRSTKAPAKARTRAFAKTLGND
jgi:hypothetical protein